MPIMSNFKPNKTQIFTTVIVLAVAGLVGYSVFLYQSQPNRHPSPSESPAQLKQQRDDAIKHAAIVQAVDKQQNEALTEQVQSLTIQKTGLCTQIKTARLVNASCN